MLFFCPICKKDISDYTIPCCVQSAGDVPILVKDFPDLENKLQVLREEKKDWYVESHLGYLNGPYRHHISKRIQYLKGLFARLKLPHDAIFLDIGCGDGFNLTWLKDHFANIFASDFNLTRALRAKGLNIGKVLIADILDYPAFDNSFDVIFFHHVLEHIPDDKKALKEVYRILKDGGKCILGVPNEGALWWQLAYKFEPESRQTTDHVHFYTLKTLCQLAQTVGFQIIETKRMGYGIPHWTLDGIVRQNKLFHDFLDILGNVFFPSQATSLYVVLGK